MGSPTFAPTAAASWLPITMPGSAAAAAAGGAAPAFDPPVFASPAAGSPAAPGVSASTDPAIRSSRRSVTFPTRCRVDAPHAHRHDLARVAAHHALGVDVGGCGHHLGHRLDAREHRGVIGERTEAVLHRQVGAVADDLVAPGALEAVHHGQHGDDQPHAGRDADDTDPGDHRDEGLAPLRHQVTHGDEPLGRVARVEQTRRGQRHEPEQNRRQIDAEQPAAQRRERRRRARERRGERDSRGERHGEHAQEALGLAGGSAFRPAPPAQRQQQHRAARNRPPAQRHTRACRSRRAPARSRGPARARWPPRADPRRGAAARSARRRSRARPPARRPRARPPCRASPRSGRRSRATPGPSSPRPPRPRASRRGRSRAG